MGRCGHTRQVAMGCNHQCDVRGKLDTAMAQEARAATRSLGGDVAWKWGNLCPRAEGSSPRGVPMRVQHLVDMDMHAWQNKERVPGRESTELRRMLADERASKQDNCARRQVSGLLTGGREQGRWFFPGEASFLAPHDSTHGMAGTYGKRLLKLDQCNV
eukprot:1152880-Pelagomonas_calceolata.AAC.9